MGLVIALCMIALIALSGNSENVNVEYSKRKGIQAGNRYGRRYAKRCARRFWR